MYYFLLEKCIKTKNRNLMLVQKKLNTKRKCEGLYSTDKLRSVWKNIIYSMVSLINDFMEFWKVKFTFALHTTCFFNFTLWEQFLMQISFAKFLAGHILRGEINGNFYCSFQSDKILEKSYLKAKLYVDRKFSFLKCIWVENGFKRNEELC